MANPHESYSFDIYGGLDERLRAAYERNPNTSGAGPSFEVSTEQQEIALAPEVAEWAEQQIALSSARWQELDVRGPVSLSELLHRQPDIAHTLHRLYDAQEQIRQADSRVGASMQLVLMPWQLMRDELPRLDTWVSDLRQAQGVADRQDRLSDLFTVLVPTHNGGGPYLDPRSLNTAEWMTAEEYLDARIAECGPWGLALIQTDYRGHELSATNMKPANDYTFRRTVHLSVMGHNVDGYGLFEWLAAAVHVTAHRPLPSGIALLANRAVDETGVPYATWASPGLGIHAVSGHVWVDDGYTLLAVV